MHSLSNILFNILFRLVHLSKWAFSLEAGYFKSFQLDDVQILIVTQSTQVYIDITCCILRVCPHGIRSYCKSRNVEE